MLPNLLNLAMTLTGNQLVLYSKFLGRSDNGIGQDIANYADSIKLTGQIQAVPRSLYEAYGLDLQRNYLNFYVSKELLDITRGVSGDKVEYNSLTYQCLSETDWIAMNGWTSVLMVQI